jgi:endogenous inhibitor of DNA gyrase (YacG/DUF329 family)
MKVPRQIKCPTCGKRGDWFATPHGPFCSRRCKLIDLGKWLGEEYRISEPLREPPAGTPEDDANRPEADDLAR